MSLKEEKQEVLKGLVSIMNEGLTNEDKLTYEMLKELKDKIEEMIKNDF